MIKNLSQKQWVWKSPKYVENSEKHDFVIDNRITLGKYTEFSIFHAFLKENSNSQC